MRLADHQPKFATHQVEVCDGSTNCGTDHIANGNYLYGVAPTP
jgi:hypothetical protein